MSVTDTTTTTDIDEAEYLAAVKEGKAICATVSGKQWALGDLTAQVAKAYGENRLEQFAVDINFDGETSTLSRYRSVCLAFPKTGGRPRFFASAQILQGRDDRFQIVTANPNISVREARELMREEQGTPTQAEQSAENKDDDNVNSGEKGAKAEGAKKTREEWSKDLSSFYSDGLEVANKVIAMKNSIQQCTPEKKASLKKGVTPVWAEKIEQGGEAWAWIRDWANGALENEADTLIQKGRVRRTPARASAPVQPGA
jgi:hypothetical protein